MKKKIKINKRKKICFPSYIYYYFKLNLKKEIKLNKTID